MSDFINFDKVAIATQNESVNVSKSIETKPVESEVKTPVASETKTPVKNAVRETVAKKTDKSKSVTKAKSSDKVKTKKISKSKSFIRDFPKDLLAVAKAEFPEASNNTDALSAYIAVKSDISVQGLPDSVQALVDAYEAPDYLQSINDRLSSLERQNTALVMILQELELGLSYLTFDYLGYRKEDASSARSVNFLENGVSDLITRMREQAKQFRAQDNIKKGRPIR